METVVFWAVRDAALRKGEVKQSCSGFELLECVCVCVCVCVCERERERERERKREGADSIHTWDELRQ